jgi:Xaa-Pro aminopeptidase
MPHETIRPETGADASLDAALAASTLPFDREALRALLEGVNAAPPGPDPRAWMRLLPEPPDLAAAAMLETARQALAAAPRPASPPLPDRLPALRAVLASEGLDLFFVPHGDEHQSEYPPAGTERLAWLTGFGGSAGIAVVGREAAAIFVDGRYTIQVREQVDPAAWEYRHLTEEPHDRWAAETLPPGGTAGYDPRIATPGWVERTRRTIEAKGGRLVPVETNPIDRIWPDRPAAPIAPAVPHPTEYAGRAAAEKRAEIAAILEREGVDAALLTAPESVAWLLNLRGGDCPHTPLMLSWAMLRRDGTVDLFVDRRKLVPDLERHLGNSVAVHEVSALPASLEAIGREGRTILLDQTAASAFHADLLRASGATVKLGDDPCALPRACKNPVELEGARHAHGRDGAAVTRFLHWLEGAWRDGVDEMEAAARLREFRAEDPLWRDDSFTTISAAGPNAALPHYRTTPEKNRTLAEGEVYLVDSGAQYLDGTTDITRTVGLGQVPHAVKLAFTLVLEGHVGVATARFPEGIAGVQIDAFARRALWQHGMDFDHGTGHGVGSYLGVHEGPARISKGGTVPLRAGMILSDEPGYYRAGSFGIRTENLIIVRPCAALPDAERPTLEFETLTLAPIDRSLILADVLSAATRAWVDAYHARVLAEIGPRVPPDVQAWLAAATAPL